MINYIKMDLFRMFRSISFYVCTLIFVFMVAATISDVRYIEKKGLKEYLGDDYEYYMSNNEDDDTVEIGIGSDGADIAVNGVNLISCISSSYTGSQLIFMVILFICIFVSGEYSTGYIKNTIVIPRYRWYFNISKLVTALVVAVIENVIAIIMFVYSIYFIFDNGEIGNVIPVVKYLFLQMLMALGLCAFVIMACDIFKSKSVCIIIAICMVMQLFTVPVLYIAKLFNIKYSLVNKFLMSITTRILPLDISNKVFIETFMLGVLGTVVYTFIGSMFINKKDI